jgi:enoyl-[acyl-carrier protein] reductase II
VLNTRVCSALGIKHPIVQGGMAHIGTHELSSAVSNAGGLGIIGAGHYDPDWLSNQIRGARSRTAHPFGVNLVLTSPFLDEIVELLVREKPAVVSTGAGDPSALIGRFKRVGIKVMPVISTVAAARKAEASGADLVVAEGTEAGGRVGETTTLCLVPQVADSVKIPVVAAGGIADGRGLVAALAAGADGVQMGTRFVCSVECVAHAKYKRKIIEAGDSATVVTRQSLGFPLRTLRNSVSEQFSMLEKAGTPREALEAFDRDRMYLGLVEGDIDEGSLIAGQI